MRALVRVRVHDSDTEVLGPVGSLAYVQCEDGQAQELVAAGKIAVVAVQEELFDGAGGALCTSG